MNQQLIQPHNNKSAATWSVGGLNYERISHSISDAIEHCISRIAPQPGEHILDVATGTGWAARLLAKRGAKVTGIDIGENLIEAAKQCALNEQLRVDFQIGDAEALSFTDNSFDAITSTFGVMFVSNPEAAASELARVCKKGGRLGLTTWFPEDTIFGLFKVMKPYQPVPAVAPPPSPFAWGTKERITELFGSAFDLKFETGNTYLREPNSRAVWELFVNSYGPTKALAASLDSGSREALKNDFITFHENYESELGVEMPREYLLTIGVRK